MYSVYSMLLRGLLDSVDDILDEFGKTDKGTERHIIDAEFVEIVDESNMIGTKEDKKND